MVSKEFSYLYSSSWCKTHIWNPYRKTLIAPQAQLFETAKDRRRQTEALFKQVVKFEQIDPLWSILGDS